MIWGRVMVNNLLDFLGDNWGELSIDRAVEFSFLGGSAAARGGDAQ